MERHKLNDLDNSSSQPITLQMTPAERIQLIANLIVDLIIEDQNNGSEIYKRALG